MATDTTIDDRDEDLAELPDEPADADGTKRAAEDPDTEPRDAEAADAPDRRERGSRVRAVLRWPARPVRPIARGLVRRPVLTLSVLGIVALVLAAAVGTATYLRQRQTATADARGAATNAARAGVTTMLSYGYQTFDRDVTRASGLLTGDFQRRYRDLMTGTVRSAALSRRTVTNASVARSSVISATPETVEALLFVNQTTTSKASQGQPQLSGSRVRVTMRKVGARWLISNVSPL